MLSVIYLVKTILKNALDSRVHKKVSFFYRVKNRLDLSQSVFLCLKFEFPSEQGRSP